MPRKPKPGVEQATFTRNARKHSKLALEVMAQLLKSPDARTRQAAAARILDYSFGRPASQAAPEVEGTTIRLIPGDDKL